MDIDASIVANFFLKKAHIEKVSISQMKLINLVYIANGWSLAVMNKDLLNGESVEAWDFGPVIPSLYHEFKRFGSDTIDIYSQTLINEEDSSFKTRPIFIDEAIVDASSKAKIKKVLESVWKGYKNYSAIDLSQKTHDEGTPWEIAKLNNKKHISKKNIREYYINFFENYQI